MCIKKIDMKCSDCKYFWCKTYIVKTDIWHGYCAKKQVLTTGDHHCDVSDLLQKTIEFEYIGM